MVDANEKQLTDSELWNEPLDESPIEIPSSWSGGGVIEQGLGMYVRQWRKETGPETLIAVEYSSPFDEIRVAEYREDGDRYYHVEDIRTVPVGAEFDSGCWETVVDILKEEG